MDSRKKAIEELKKQIKLGRERLGPEGIKQLEQLVKSGQKIKTAPDMVPYDKTSALEAFKIFLKNHGNPALFEKKLREMMKKTDQ